MEAKFFKKTYRPDSWMSRNVNSFDPVIFILKKFQTKSTAKIDNYLHFLVNFDEFKIQVLVTFHDSFRRQKSTLELNVFGDI